MVMAVVVKMAGLDSGAFFHLDQPFWFLIWRNIEGRMQLGIQVVVMEVPVEMGEMVEMLVQAAMVNLAG